MMLTFTYRPVIELQYNLTSKLPLSKLKHTNVIIKSKYNVHIAMGNIEMIIAKAISIYICQPNTTLYIHFGVVEHSCRVK